MMARRIHLDNMSAGMEYKRVCCESCLGVARRRILPREVHVIGIDDLAFNAVPQPYRFQGLHRRPAVRRAAGTCDGNHPDAGFQKVLQPSNVRRALRWDPKHQPAESENGAAVPEHFPLFNQLVNVLGVSRQEEVKRRSVLNLLRQLCRRSVAEQHTCPSLQCECFPDLFENGVKVRCSGNGQFARVPRLLTPAPGSAQAQYAGQHGNGCLERAAAELNIWRQDTSVRQNTGSLHSERNGENEE